MFTAYLQLTFILKKRATEATIHEINASSQCLDDSTQMSRARWVSFKEKVDTKEDSRTGVNTEWPAQQPTWLHKSKNWQLPTFNIRAKDETRPRPAYQK